MRFWQQYRKPIGILSGVFYALWWPSAWFVWLIDEGTYDPASTSGQWASFYFEWLRFPIASILFQWNPETGHTWLDLVSSMLYFLGFFMDAFLYAVLLVYVYSLTQGKETA